MSQTILVPLDGSMLAERALRPAIDFAKLRGASLKFLQVVPPETDTQSAMEYLQGRAEGPKAAELEVECQVLQGFPIKTILDALENTDLLVLCSHGRSGFDRIFLGSVAEKVTRRSPCPTLVVRANPLFLEEVQRILVPLDGSNLCLDALPEAVRLCKATDATLVLCRINEAALFGSLIPIEEERERLRGYLAEVAQELDPSVKVELLPAFGPAPKTLVREISAQGIDLVVMTSHGRSGFDRMVAGSVAESILRTSPTAVLLVPSRGD